MRTLWICYFLLAALAAAAGASSFSGSYTTNTEGGEFTLQLTESPAGAVTGTFSAAGTVLNITGTVSGGRITATATLAEAPIRFSLQIVRQGDNLVMEITEEGPDGKPDPQTTERYVFPAAMESPVSPPASEPVKIASTANPIAHSANPLAAKADPYIGTFTNGEMSVIISGGKGQYTGKISFGGGEYPFTARKGASGLEGTFRAESERFPFTATLQGATLRLSSGGATHALTRRGAPAAPAKPANPLTGPRPAGGKPQASSAPAASSWKVLRHPVGLSIRYPASWTAKRLEGASYQLVPPDAAGDAQGPAEAYFLMGADAQSYAQANDPGLIQLLEGQVLQLAPFLRRAAGPNPVKCGPETGAVLAWEGTNSAGKSLRARMYVVLVKGFAVCLFALGRRERVDARDPQLRDIFATLGASQEERDPRIAGAWTWVGEKTGGAQNSMQQTSSVSSRQASLQLQAEGSASRSTTSQTMASSQFKNSLGESTGAIYLDTGPSTSTKNGRWYAGDGRLVLLWNDDTAEEYSYRIEAGQGGRRLLLTADKGGTEIWETGPGQ